VINVSVSIYNKHSIKDQTTKLYTLLKEVEQYKKPQQNTEYVEVRISIPPSRVGTDTTEEKKTE